MGEPAAGEAQQLTLGASRPRRRAARVSPAPLAAELPVARVAVDTPLAHLDRPFDYLVPASLADHAVVGSRVRVRFAGRLVDGFVLDRVAGSDHEGTLAPLASAPSGEPVLSPQIARLAREVADRWAGTLADVLRLAVPPRHAGAEQSAGAAGPREPVSITPDPAPWRDYASGPAFLDALRRGDAPHAVWSALPGPSWTTAIGAAVAATVAGGRGAIVIAPDARDVARLDAALGGILPKGKHTVLSADLGPQRRYRRFLEVRRGCSRVVVGTRAAVYAPVEQVGLIVVWDDADDALDEPRAPYANARDVAVLRAHLEGAAVLIGGRMPSVEAAALVESGWARELRPERSALRAAAARVVPRGDDDALARDVAARSARLPRVAWQAAKTALAGGSPVLVQVARRGYQPSVACASCRAPARCQHCSGPLARASSSASLACRWCGRPAADWVCRACGGRRIRAGGAGSARTAEELGRAFPGVPVQSSSGESPIVQVPRGPSIVVATPGVEPVAADGYGAVLLLDAEWGLTRTDLHAAEETLRRWFNAAALARADGTVVVTADAALPAVQALIRHDPLGFASRELRERRQLGFPPAVRMASVTGSRDAIAEFLDAVHLPPGARVLGPVPSGEDERVLVTVARAEGGELAAALRAASSVRSARKLPVVRVQLDPRDVF